MFCRKFIRFAVLLVLAASVLAPLSLSQARVVAVGDIHGELEGFKTILQEAGVIDANGKWIGQNITLVQTGDAIDRGPAMRPVLDLLMALEKEAPRKNSRVIALLGNHEVMNMFGDLRFVAPENFASFADGNSEKRRKSAWAAYVDWRQQRAKAVGQAAPVFSPETEKAWMDAHPPGFLEQREAFGPSGKYGKWLRGHAAIVQAGGIIFLHGGIKPEVAGLKIEDLNKRISEEIKAFDNARQALSDGKVILPFFTIEEILAVVRAELEARKEDVGQKTAQAAEAKKTYVPTPEEKQRIDFLEGVANIPNWLSMHPDGPLWFRGYHSWADGEGAEYVNGLLKAYGASQIVVGHTVQAQGRIRPRFDGRVFLIDTGMLTSYFKGGQASALEIQNGKFSAIYQAERVAFYDHGVVVAPSALPPASRCTGDAAEVSYGDGPAPGQNGPAVSPRPGARVWLGPDGNPLPFKTEEEILDFLRTAKVVSSKEIGTGITHPRNFLLEGNGVRAHAVFRDVNEQKDVAVMQGGKREMFFRDSYLFEPAAYELSKLMGLDSIPPTVLRRYQGVSGSLQLFVEQAMSETKRQRGKIKPPDVVRWNRQVQTMRLWDNLVYNTDRNMGNILITPDWKLWMIDHTRAFRRYKEVRDTREVIICERKFWNTLQTVSDDAIRARVKNLLHNYEVEALLVRRRVLVDYIRSLIAEKGEDKVLFSLE